MTPAAWERSHLDTLEGENFDYSLFDNLPYKKDLSGRWRCVETGEFVNRFLAEAENDEECARQAELNSASDDWWDE